MKRLLTAALFALCLAAQAAEPVHSVMLFDFRDSQLHGWRGNSQVKSLTPTPEGLQVAVTGREDPWIEGPAIPALPEGDYTKMLVEARFRNTGSTQVQMFWGKHFNAADACNFASPANDTWVTATAVVPRLEPGTRLRLDPCHTNGSMTLAWVRATPMVSLFRPDFPTPQPIALSADAPAVTAGALTVRHHPTRWDAFTVELDGTLMAAGLSCPQLTAVAPNGTPLTLDLAQAKTSCKQTPDGLQITAAVTDADGVTWTLTRTFAALRDGHGDAIRVTTSCTPNRDAQLANLCLLTLFPGLGSFGQRKQQALLAGAEYLVADESSSSELDVKGANANRLSVDPVKLCLPLMALAADGRWLSLSWDDSGLRPATVFDVPDRQYRSGANLWGLWLPGVGRHRLDGDLNTYLPMPVAANQTLALSAVIAGGPGETVIPAVQAHVARLGQLPPLPTHAPDFQGAIRLLAAGYLDSAANVNHTWRHAVVPNPKAFTPTVAADAILYMAWLAANTADHTLAQRLRQEVAAALPAVLEGKTLRSIAHNPNPIHIHLFFNRIQDWLDTNRRNALDFLARQVRPDGSFPFVKPEKLRHHFGSTHWTDHANGLTAVRGVNASLAALASASPELRNAYLNWLDKVFDLYRNDAPRGAQTWEIPLHTPDILASAYLLDHAVAAYQLTGNPKYLQTARYWAWTGVPFVYLTDPARDYGPNGLYATIAVLGATGWSAPFWIGLPVQWCGMVYRNALCTYLDLLRQLPDTQSQVSLWSQIAAGITLTGLNMTFPLSDQQRQGLLPDVYVLQTQESTGPAINPGTTLTHLPQAYGQRPVIAQTRLGTGVMAFALGDIAQLPNGDLQLDLWPESHTQVLISGLPPPPPPPPP
ncbi:MAG: hypothetical protein ACI4WT_04155, partial [Oligosphaeraceae bacterium]